MLTEMTKSLHGNTYFVDNFHNVLFLRAKMTIDQKIISHKTGGKSHYINQSSPIYIMNYNVPGDLV